MDISPKVFSSIKSLSLLLRESDHTIDPCMDSEVSTDIDIASEMIFASCLSRDDTTSVDSLSTKYFDATKFRITILDVLYGTGGFFVCHMRYYR